VIYVSEILNNVVSIVASSAERAGVTCLTLNAKDGIFQRQGGDMKCKCSVTTIFTSTLLGISILGRAVANDISPKVIQVTAKRFVFEPAEITVEKGEPVVLELKSVDVPHGLRIRELNLDVKVGKGATIQAPFTPEALGDFVGHCSVFCGPGHGKMTLIIHVVKKP